MSSRPQSTTVAVIGPEIYVRHPNGTVVRQEQPSQADLAATFAQQSKQQKAKKKRKPYEFDRIPDANLNRATKRFLKKLDELKILEGFDFHIGDLVWKSLTVWRSGEYSPHAGDAVRVIDDEGDDTAQEIVLYWSKAVKRPSWVLKNPKVPNHRTFIFDLYAQGSGAIPGISMSMDGTFSGELVIWQSS